MYGNLISPCRSVSEVKRYFKPLTFQFGRKWLISFVKMRIPPEGYLVVNVSYSSPYILVVLPEHYVVAFPVSKLICMYSLYARTKATFVWEFLMEVRYMMGPLLYLEVYLLHSHLLFGITLFGYYHHLK